MQTLISSKYQVVIPKKVRQNLSLKKGQKLQIRIVGENILLSPNLKWPDDYVEKLSGKLEIEDVMEYLDSQRDLWQESS